MGEGFSANLTEIESYATSLEGRSTGLREVADKVTQHFEDFAMASTVSPGCVGSASGRHDVTQDVGTANDPTSSANRMGDDGDVFSALSATVSDMFFMLSANNRNLADSVHAAAENLRGIATLYRRLDAR
jgi:hypothetical protein